MNKPIEPYARGYGDAGGGYEKRSLRAFVASSGSPQTDIDPYNSTLRQRGRMLYMAAPVAAGAIRGTVTNAVGCGLELKSRIRREMLGMTPEQAKAWQTKAESEWRLWASRKDNCDARGISTFDELQRIAMTSALMSGDCFALIQRREVNKWQPYSMRVLLVEADLVSTPTDNAVTPAMGYGVKAKNGNYIYDGVEVDKDTGQVTAYHVCNRYPDEFIYADEPLKWVRVDAFGKRTGLPNVLHIMEPERPGQYRGVTFLAPVIEPLLQIRRYTESELMGALVQSFFTAWIKTESDPAEWPTNEVESESHSEDNANYYEMGPGGVIHLKPGESVEFGHPQIPSNGFDRFVDAVATQVGAALRYPKEVLLQEFNASYSASRGALLEAYRTFKLRRNWLVTDFCQPIYETFLSEAIARGRIKAPGFFDDPAIRAAYCGSRWIGPAQTQIDPVKDVTAEILAVQHGFKTHAQATVELDGGDWEENAEQLTHEVMLLPHDCLTTVNVNFGPDKGKEGEE